MRKTALALIPDTSPPMRTLIRRAFESAECDVVWTADVSEAMRATERHHFELLLLDLDRPLHQGWGIVEPLAALNSSAPIVLLTENKAADEVAVADRIGAVLQKPCSLAALAHTFQVLLGERTPAPEKMAAEDPGFSAALAASAAFRDSLDRRSTSAYVSTPAHRFWGINE